MDPNPCYPQAKSCGTLCAVESKRYGRLLETSVDDIDYNHHAIYDLKLFCNLFCMLALI